MLSLFILILTACFTDYDRTLTDVVMVGDPATESLDMLDENSMFYTEVESGRVVAATRHWDRMDTLDAQRIYDLDMALRTTGCKLKSEQQETVGRLRSVFDCGGDYQVTYVYNDYGATGTVVREVRLQ